MRLDEAAWHLGFGSPTSIKKVGEQGGAGGAEGAGQGVRRRGAPQAKERCVLLRLPTCMPAPFLPRAPTVPPPPAPCPAVRDVQAMARLNISKWPNRTRETAKNLLLGLEVGANAQGKIWARAQRSGRGAAQRGRASVVSLCRGAGRERYRGAPFKPQAFSAAMPRLTAPLPLTCISSGVPAALLHRRDRRVGHGGGAPAPGALPCLHLWWVVCLLQGRGGGSQEAWKGGAGAGGQLCRQCGPPRVRPCCDVSDGTLGGGGGGGGRGGRASGTA